MKQLPLLFLCLCFACKHQQFSEAPKSPKPPPPYQLLLNEAQQTAFLVDSSGRYHHSWSGVTAQTLPEGLNAGSLTTAVLQPYLHRQPPFNAIEIKQSQTRDKNDRQYKRLMRETFAELEVGYLDDAIQYLRPYLQKEPRDAEALYCLALWQTQQYQFDSAIVYIERALETGLPIGRLLAGPDQMWEPLWRSATFQNWLGRQKVPLLLHGPMIGDLTDQSVQIWGRTHLEKKVQVIFYDATGKEVQRVSGAGRNETDRTFCLKAENLRPNTPYSYVVEVDGRPMREPISFQTRSAKGAGSQFRIAFGGGAGYTPEYERMWDTLLSRQPDALLLLGDNVYIDHPERPGTQAYCYHRRQSRPEWRRLTAKTPVYTIWDDHDFTYNDERGGAAVDSPYWKRPVWQLYQKQWANPYYGGGEPQPGCYYDFSIGDVDFFMLDTRYYRENPEIPGASMLGPVQKQWLMDKLARSTATFKIICTSVPLTENTKPGSLDTWDGHAAERKEILGFLGEQKIKGVVFLAADRHRSDSWKTDRAGDYPLYEFMSSRLTNIHTHQIMEASLFGYNEKCSFGLVEFDTQKSDPELTYRIVNIDNEELYHLTLKRSELE